ncbi:B3 DNA binding domain containing protein [Trema orientale]|uniref:B3 DNA binding domain containing protein n=1 Tax=Trema orientale TaxID=63057 RepID=A0A2P5EBJ4_TREOI|nr:B3 DNA binding domain containing protein [Trema orientale]
MGLVWARGTATMTLSFTLDQRGKNRKLFFSFREIPSDPINTLEVMIGRAAYCSSFLRYKLVQINSRRYAVRCIHLLHFPLSLAQSSTPHISEKMENNTNNGNDEKEFLFQKIMKKTDLKNKFLRLNKDDAEKFFGYLGEGETETRTIDFMDHWGNLQRFDYGRRKIDQCHAYVLGGANWRSYVSHSGLKEGRAVKFYRYGNRFFIEVENNRDGAVSLPGPGITASTGRDPIWVSLKLVKKIECILVASLENPYSKIEAATTLRSEFTGVISQPENTVVHSPVNPSIQTAPYTSLTGVPGATVTTPTNSPGAAENPSTSRRSQSPSAPAVPESITGGVEVPTSSLPSAVQTGRPNSGTIDWDDLIIDTDQDHQLLTNTNSVPSGHDDQRYLDQYMKYDQGFSNKLNSAQNEHVRLFVLHSVGSIMRILETNHIGEVGYDDLFSQINNYWSPISVFGLDLSPLKELVEVSLRKLCEFEQTKRQVDDDCKTVETIEKDAEVERKNLESAKHRLEEYTEQAREKKSRIEEGNNLLTRMRGSPLLSVVDDQYCAND